MNEFLLILNVLVIFSFVVLFFKLFGKTGLFISTVIASILANIEVVILVKAFGVTQTLGNVLFASSFLCTDIASEVYGKKLANKIVNAGILTSVLFIFVTITWRFYIPFNDGENVEVYNSMLTVFSNTPRILISGFLVYGICQKFDVFIYHFIWNKTNGKIKDKRKFLFVRNNLSTLTSQLLNTVLFTFFAFYKTYDLATILNIIVSSYVIFFVLSLLDTFFIYLARSIYEKGKVYNL